MSDLVVRFSVSGRRASVYPCQEWEEFDRVAALLEEALGASVTGRFDGPEGSRRWLFEAGGAVVELHFDDTRGTELVAPTAASVPLLERAAQALAAALGGNVERAEIQPGAKPAGAEAPREGGRRRRLEERVAVLKEAGAQAKRYPGSVPDLAIGDDRELALFLHAFGAKFLGATLTFKLRVSGAAVNAYAALLPESRHLLVKAGALSRQIELDESERLSSRALEEALAELEGRELPGAPGTLLGDPVWSLPATSARASEDNGRLVVVGDRLVLAGASELLVIDPGDGQVVGKVPLDEHLVSDNPDVDRSIAAIERGAEPGSVAVSISSTRYAEFNTSHETSTRTVQLEGLDGEPLPHQRPRKFRWCDFGGTAAVYFIGARRLLTFNRDGLVSRWAVGEGEMILEEELVAADVAAFAREYRFRKRHRPPPAYLPHELPSTPLYTFDPLSLALAVASRERPAAARPPRRSRNYEVHYGRRYAIGFRGDRVRAWDIATGQVLRTVSVRGNSPPSRVLIRTDDSEAAFGEARCDNLAIAALPSLEIESVPKSGFVRGHVEEPVLHRSPRFLIDRSASLQTYVYDRESGLHHQFEEPSLTLSDDGAYVAFLDGGRPVVRELEGGGRLAFPHQARADSLEIEVGEHRFRLSDTHLYDERDQWPFQARSVATTPSAIALAGASEVVRFDPATRTLAPIPLWPRHLLSLGDLVIGERVDGSALDRGAVIADLRDLRTEALGGAFNSAVHLSDRGLLVVLAGDRLAAYSTGVGALVAPS